LKNVARKKSERHSVGTVSEFIVCDATYGEGGSKESSFMSCIRDTRAIPLAQGNFNKLGIMRVDGREVPLYFVLSPTMTQV